MRSALRNVLSVQVFGIVGVMLMVAAACLVGFGLDYRTKQEAAQAQRGAISLVTAIVEADGRVEPAEVKALSETVATIQSADFEARANSIRNRIDTTLGCAVNVAKADGKICNEEAVLIRAAAYGCGVDPATVLPK